MKNVHLMFYVQHFTDLHSLYNNGTNIFFMLKLMLPVILENLLPNNLPRDCLQIISDFLPRFTQERCFHCSFSLIKTDFRGRIHFHKRLVCTESVILCQSCFEAINER